MRLLLCLYSVLIIDRTNPGKIHIQSDLSSAVLLFVFFFLVRNRISVHTRYVSLTINETGTKYDMNHKADAMAPSSDRAARSPRTSLTTVLANSAAGMFDLTSSLLAHVLVSTLLRPCIDSQETVVGSVGHEISCHRTSQQQDNFHAKGAISKRTVSLWVVCAASETP